MVAEGKLIVHGDGTITGTHTALMLKPTKWGPYEWKSGGSYEETVVVVRGEGHVLDEKALEELRSIVEFFAAHNLKVVIE